jgi:CHASE2 domain-containing sensor protein
MRNRHARAARLRHIRADVLIGLLVTAMLITAKWFFEHTMLGEQFEEAVYDVLQLRRGADLDEAQLPVAVIDIDPMPLERHPESRELDFTSRTGLRDVVANVAAQRPRAIGVDVDFTPARGPQLAADREFFEFILDPSRPNRDVPVFVAVHDAVQMGERVLVSPKYMDLAAFIGHPIPGEFESPKKMVDWVEVDSTDAANSGPVRFPSLASAVAQKGANDPSRWVAWLFEKPTGRSGRLIYHEFVVDYSPLEALKKHTLPFTDRKITLSSSHLAGKIVLLGRPNAKDDQVTLPGRRGRRYGGVYVHASAAYTLDHGPLLKLSPAGRLVLDAGVAFVIILAVACVRIRYLSTSGEVRHGSVQGLFTLLAVAGVIALAFYLVNVHRLMWDDSLFVAAALALHSLTERYTVKLWRHSTSALRTAWRGLLFGRRTDA